MALLSNSDRLHIAALPESVNLSKAAIRRRRRVKRARRVLAITGLLAVALCALPLLLVYHLRHEAAEAELERMSGNSVYQAVQADPKGRAIFTADQRP
jgi:hypothetical protein